MRMIKVGFEMALVVLAVFDLHRSQGGVGQWSAVGSHAAGGTVRRRLTTPPPTPTPAVLLPAYESLRTACVRDLFGYSAEYQTSNVCQQHAEPSGLCVLSWGNHYMRELAASFRKCIDVGKKIRSTTNGTRMGCGDCLQKLSRV